MSFIHEIELSGTTPIEDLIFKVHNLEWFKSILSKAAEYIILHLVYCNLSFLCFRNVTNS